MNATWLTLPPSLPLEQVMIFPDELQMTEEPRPAAQPPSAERAALIPQREQHRQIASLSELMSNSVYDPNAVDGCQITCASNRAMWKTAGKGTAALTGTVVDESVEVAAVEEEEEAADGSGISEDDFVGILHDSTEAGKHLLVLRSMAALDKHAIANRLGKFSSESQQANGECSAHHVTCTMCIPCMAVCHGSAMTERPVPKPSLQACTAQHSTAQHRPAAPLVPSSAS